MPNARRQSSLPSEDGILDCISSHFPNSHPGFLLCRGDDCAMFSTERDLCVSTDLFLEDVHFRRSYFTPREVGHKSLAVNISDLAACGAKPLGFVLSLGLPQGLEMPWLNEFFAGMAELAGKYNMALAGGDLSRSPQLHVSITAFGENLEGCTFLRRGGSIPGDTIFVVGELGLARVGLLELEAEGRAAIHAWPRACAAHLQPQPQVDAGLMLARAGNNARPPALMDISDGILRDLPRMLGQSGELGSHSKRLGARLSLPPTVMSGEITRHAQAAGKDPVLEMLIGGEDYALLGSCAPDMVGALQAAIPGFYCIGEVTDDGAIACDGKNIDDLRGFDHFERKN